jgi:3-methylcrotonyl-CoA carboxylase alpha subunit
MPSVGRLEHFDLGEEGRIETGVEEGDVISPFYDPMIAKLVARGDTRDEAIEELAAILDEAEVWPVKTNAGFLFNAVLNEDFGAGRIDTGFIERKLDELVPDGEPDDALWRAAAAVATAEDEGDASAGLAGFRLNAPSQPSASLGHGGEFRRILLDDEQEMAAATGFRDDERVVVFYEGPGL